MKYEFVACIEEVINQCITSGSGVLHKKDDEGNSTLLLRSEWVDYEDGISDVVQVHIINPNTGVIQYSINIEETKTPK